ncbi:GbsR/MarR family transcriptional regulator [Actinocrispum wychmicini]|uniref:MarR family protein n=1 Tax=Actinocrispum wychmicini TaxID=1213861 RepID=A0A4R2JN70_9PSEU|nr:MarR family transcriptional regulator [Actinocrispum wychmicini]TCO58119.1 MarR family protein [Actinocrispum wychmicini]
MAGGRLTQRDRQHIASGLAGGLGYAEIARRLDRPTSTVSREIARNGGPGAYQADQAHRATWRRARRPKLTTARRPAMPGDPVAARDFVERFAALLVQTGMPRMAARVFTCLITTDSGALTAVELVQRLTVSPASVSKAVGYLESLDLIERERGPRRQERYLIDDDIWLRTWLTSAKQNAMWADAAQEGADIFGAATPSGARMAQMGRFFAQLSQDMAGDTTPPTSDDAFTVLAALVHALGEPRTIDELAVALDWPKDRVATALNDARRRPDMTDPVTVHRLDSGAYTAAARPGRLTAAQREALRGS